MIKGKLILFIFLATILVLSGCIDPYTPKLSGYGSQLVVEGLVTNENTPYTVTLSRTFQSNDTIAERVSDAIVSITDEAGTETALLSSGNGIYKTDSTVFTGEIGKTYTLHVLLKDGTEYQSEPGTMLPVPDIDSLYYIKDRGFTNNQTEIHDGITILLDSKEADNVNNYFRWEYEETWKFRLPTIPRYNYIAEDTILPIPTNETKEFCWKQLRSTDIIIQAFSAQQSGNIKNCPITFIASDISDRLTIQYSILVKQYSISNSEYKFWDNLNKMNENSGDIFGSQPYSLSGNIFNVKNKNERVLGYFEISAVSKKRIDVTFNELLKLNLPLYHYKCKRYLTSPSDYCQAGAWGCVPPTWDELYVMWTNAHFNFIEPSYDPITKKLFKVVFATIECSDCEKTGTTSKPSFWVDRY